MLKNKLVKCNGEPNLTRQISDVTSLTFLEKRTVSTQVDTCLKFLEKTEVKILILVDRIIRYYRKLKRLLNLEKLN